MDDDKMEVEMINDDDELESDDGSENEDAEVYVPKIKLAEGKKSGTKLSDLFTLLKIKIR